MFTDLQVLCLVKIWFLGFIDLGFICFLVAKSFKKAMEIVRYV